MELASRDVVSRRMTQHMKAGHGVASASGAHLWLDIRHLGAKHINVNLREVAEICRNFIGVDPVTELMPVRPAQHYSMGGVRTDIDGRAAGMAGLYAAGESSCWDRHGFNRLGGNSLAETVVMGQVVGETVAKDFAGLELAWPSALADATVRRVEERIRSLVSRSAGRGDVYGIRRRMEETLTGLVSIFRNGADLTKAVEILQGLEQEAANVGLKSAGVGADPELSSALRLPGQLRLALSIAYGALMRQESRGSHYREDFPKRDDKAWHSRTLSTWKEGDKLPHLSYESVAITELPPGDRGYGEASAAGKTAADAGAKGASNG